MSFDLNQLAGLPAGKRGTLIHVGAGRCSELDSWRKAGFRRIVLIEADQSRVSELRSRTEKDANVQVLDQAVSGQDGTGEFRILNYPDASSLREPERLLELFPGIRVEKRVPQTIKSINTILDELELGRDALNGLIIDAPGEEFAITEALVGSERIELLNLVVVQASSVPLYADGRPMNAIEGLLSEKGFTEGKEEKGADAIRSIKCFQRDVNTIQRKKLEAQLKEEREKNNELETSNEQERKKRQDWQSHLNQVEKKWKDLEKSLGQEQEKRKELAASLKQEEKKRKGLEESLSLEQEKRKKLEVSLNQEEKKRSGLEESLRKEQEGREEISTALKQERDKRKELEERPKLADELEERLLKKITSRIDNSAKQVESYIQLNSFFDRGELLPDLHGWPISPDLAVYLMRTIKRDDYDLIIEFGSGSSTVLMAQAIAQKLLGRPMKEIQGRVSELLLEAPKSNGDADASSRNLARLSDRSSRNGADIVPRLVAFEHMREYFEKTQNALENAGVTDLVELAHAPLQDYQHADGENYLYYQCDSHLQSLSSRLAGVKPRLLVLVDGPPGKTGPKARFPALPFVLKYFGSATIDFVMDDSNRHEEGEVLKAWEVEAEKRGYRVEAEKLPFEKGAAILRLR